MKKHLFPILMTTLFALPLFAQNSGPDPRYIFNGDNGYNPLTIRNPILFGDNIGRLQFSGWLSQAEKWYPGAEIKAVVTGTPGTSLVPSDLLFLTGGSTLKERLRILENGNVGINISNPSARLSVFEYGSPNKTIFEATGGITGGSQKKFQIKTASDGLLNTLLQGSMEIESGNLVVKDGKLGVGLEPNDLPGDHKFYVNGSAICTKMIVELKTNWPDYVFSVGYKLMPLKALEAYINKEKHLPGVSSAAEISKNGLDLGEMNRVLLEKVEHLTLYAIKQQKELDALKERLEKVEAKRKK